MTKKGTPADPAEITDPAPVVGTGDPPTEVPPGDDPGSLDYDEPDDPAVPLERFQTVSQQAEDERRARQDLQGRYEQLLAKHEETVDRLANPQPTPANPGDPDLKNLPQPPEGLSNLEVAYWHIHQGMRRNLKGMLKQELGDSMEKLKTLPIDAIKHTTVESQWTGLCLENKIDSSSRLTRLAFMQLLDQGATPEQAIKSLKEAGAAAPKRSATPITPGATSSAEVERVMPRDKGHAADLARRGKVIPHFGIEDVFAERARRKAKA